MSGEITDEDLIPEVNVLVMLTNRGYVKRLPDGTYRTQHRGGRGVTGMTMRETDGVQRMVAANSHDSLLFFTNRGRVFHIKVHELPDSGRTAKGTPVINLIGIQPGEAITTLLPVRNFADATYLFMCTRSGRVKRTRLDQFSSVRASGLIAISLDEGDELAWVRMTSGSDDLILVTEQGQSIRFHEEDVRAMGRQAAGVIGIRMNPEDRVIAAEVVAPDCDLLVVSANGYGKRTPLDEYRVQYRGGHGITAMKVTERNGPLAAARVVCDTDTIMLVSTHGMVIRVPAEQISRIGRATQGVGIMRVHNDDLVASITVIRTTQDEEIANVEEASVAPASETSTNGLKPEA
jgi:DNA gyrase subunit A